MENEIRKHIIANIHEGDVLKNWTPKHGYTGNDLTVLSVDSNTGKITIDLPGSKKGEVTVSVSEILPIYNLWDKIKSEEITRTQYTNEGIKSQKTRYILNILKYLEDIGAL